MTEPTRTMPLTELWLCAGIGAVWYVLNMLTRPQLLGMAMASGSPLPLVLVPAIWFLVGGVVIAVRCPRRTLAWTGLALAVAWLLELALLQFNILQLLRELYSIVMLLVQAAAALLGVFVGTRLRRRT